MSKARAVDLIIEGVEQSLQTYYRHVEDGRKVLGGGNIQDRNKDHQIVYGSTSNRVGEDKLVHGHLYFKRKWRGKYHYYKVNVKEIKSNGKHFPQEDEGDN
jgi:hypothetical protein|tara:strand:- start:43 stop:345 length:303 start_codon:yes stop_codon:yes gene_type:complete